MAKFEVKSAAAFRDADVLGQMEVIGESGGSKLTDTIAGYENIEGELLQEIERCHNPGVFLREGDACWRKSDETPL